MKEAIVKLAGARDCQLAIEYVKVGDPVEIDADYDRPGDLIASAADGSELGRLTSKSWVARDLDDGKVVLHASVNSISDTSGGSDYLTVNVRIVTGELGETFEMPPELPPSYPVNLVGEQYHAEAVAAAEPGDPVQICHEEGNPYDDEALAAFDRHGRRLGYLPRDSFVQEVVFDENKGLTARVSGAHIGSGFRQLVLEIAVGGEECEARPYREDGR